MKKIPLKNLPFSLTWLVACSMAILSLDVVAKKNRSRLDSEVAYVATTQQPDVSSDVTTQEHVSVLQQQLDLFKGAVERFRSCLVERNCSDEERSVVVDMANLMLELSLIAAGIGIVETGEFVAEKIRPPKGTRRGRR